MKITILLSTYNGEKYLREQLDSLYGLDNAKDISILVRDDGSKDGTQEILKEYQKEHSNFSWYQGENKGPAKSFWEMLSKVSGADYYAFSDQDDVWDKDKLTHAIAKLEKIDNKKPLLYMSDTREVDAELKPLSDGWVDKNVPTNFYASLSNSVCPGCTFVFNEELRKKAIKFDADKYIDHHDWTMYKIACLFGGVYFDKSSHMSYRQHGNNVIGAKKGLAKYWDILFKKVKDPKFIHQRQRNAKALLEYYGDEMNEEYKHVLELIANYSEDKKITRELLKEKRLKYSTSQYLYFKYLVRKNVL